MKLLFTGANGFLGSNVIPLLKMKKFSVSTLGRENCNYQYDITNEIPKFQNKFEVVFHAAGKAHVVPQTEQEAETFFKINFEGTKNLCNSLEKNPPSHFIFISTVAVYGKEFGVNILETEPLLGATPYAASKKLAENFLIEWCKDKKVILTILRPSLVAGPNPPGNLGDMIKGIKKGFYFNIAGGKAKKSVMWVEDFSDLVGLIVKSNGGIFNVCDDQHPSFAEIAKKITKKIGKSESKNIPLYFAKILAFGGDYLCRNAPFNSIKLKKITEDLTFSNQEIKRNLGWSPTNVLEKL